VANKQTDGKDHAIMCQRFYRTWLALAFVALLLTFGSSPVAAAAFSADIKTHLPKPVRCPDGAALCGPAQVAGFGTAEFSLFLVSAAPATATCGRETQLADYTALVTFRLSDGSQLTLLETGTACYPGASGATSGAVQSFGNPRSWTGTWVVRNATGMFSGTTGAGTSAGRSSGADISVTYLGSIEP
jgi:hypothetical protein